MTTEPNAIVAPIHTKAMPVILRTQEEVDLWMTAPAQEALTLQRPLPAAALRIVARGGKSDGCRMIGVWGGPEANPQQSAIASEADTCEAKQQHRAGRGFGDARHN